MVAATAPAQGQSLVDDADYVRQLSITLSRETNLLNPNETLARRVIQLALQNADSLDGFVKASATFGLKRHEFLSNLHSEIKALASGVTLLDGSKGAGAGGMKFGTIVVEDAEVMMPAPVKPGGLARTELKGERPVFRAPATPRSSVLGLDQLAAEKRKEREEKERDAKRPRLDSDAPPSFRGALALSNSQADLAAPIRPPASGNVRQRVEDTPSHPGGISETARKKLEEYRRNRSGGDAQADSRVERGPTDSAELLASFNNRLNRDRLPRPPRERDMPPPPPMPPRGGSRGDTSLMRQVMATPTNAAPIVNRAWDSTPSAGERSTARRSWDATPRTDRGGGSFAPRE